MKRWIIVLVMMALLLSACQKENPMPEKSMTSSPTAEFLPSLEVISLENAARLVKLASLPIPNYQKGAVSQCNTSFSKDGSLLAGACGKNQVVVWNVSTGQVQSLLSDPSTQIVTCSFSPTENDVIACGGFDRQVTLWNARTGAQIAVAATLNSAVWDIAFSPDGSTLAICGFSDPLQMWNLEGKQMMWESTRVTSCLSTVFDPQGSALVYGTINGTSGIVRARDGAFIGELTSMGMPVGDITFSHNGKLAAAGRDNNSGYLWTVADALDINGYTLVQNVKGHSGYVNGVAFSPDDSILMTSSHDTDSFLWDTSTGDKIESLSGHQDAVLRGTFSPDGKIIATISWDGVVLLFGVPDK